MQNGVQETRAQILREMRRRIETTGSEARSYGGEYMSSGDAHDATRKAMATGKPQDHAAAAELHNQAASTHEATAGAHRKASAQHSQLANPNLPG